MSECVEVGRWAAEVLYLHARHILDLRRGDPHVEPTPPHAEEKAEVEQDQLEKGGEGTRGGGEGKGRGGWRGTGGEGGGGGRGGREG